MTTSHATPTSIRGVRTIAVTVSDHEAALDFFVGTLGFEVRVDAWAGPSMRWVEVAPPDAPVTVALVVRDAGGSGSGGQEAGVRGVDTGIRFAVPDAGHEHAVLREKGVTVGELLHWDGVPPMFTVEDPDGNRFVVVEDPR